MIIVTNPGELPGPTGDFPKGKACPDDEGELVVRFNLEIGQNGQPIVVLSFGKEVGWIGLEHEQIDGFCEKLQEMKKRAQEVILDRELGIKKEHHR